jgi:DNA-binding NarL/FixJ family response regulator
MRTASCGPVLVVDSDAKTRAVLVNVLGRAGLVACEAEDGHEALRFLEEHRTEAVILEVATRGVSGYALCRFLRAQFGEWLPIIFLSGDRVDPRDRTAGLLLGADDYLVKPFDPDELLVRLQRLMARSMATHRVRDGGVPGVRSELTPRESEVLALLSDGLNQMQIAQTLVISPNTVSTHIQRILHKLGVRSRAHAVAIATRERLVPLNGTETLQSALDVSRRRA